MIKISAAEFSNLQRETQSLHSESISLIKEYIGLASSIIARDGGINDTLITSRISMLTGRIESEILPKLSEAFSEGEQAERLLAEEITEEDEKGEGESGWLR